MIEFIVLTFALGLGVWNALAIHDLNKSVAYLILADATRPDREQT